MAEEVVTVCTSEAVRIFTLWSHAIQAGAVTPSPDPAENAAQFMDFAKKVTGEQ